MAKALLHETRLLKATSLLQGGGELCARLRVISLFRSSFIQTVLSAPESHRIG